MITCLVIAANYESFLHWCRNNGFKKESGYYIKYEFIENKSILKRARYVSGPSDLHGYNHSKIEIIKAGLFIANPLYRNGHSHLIEHLEHRINIARRYSYTAEINQEFDKLLEEL